MAAPQILDRIRKEIMERDPRYPINAYEFVLSGLDFYLTSIGEKRHVSGQEFSVGLLKFAHKQFGLLAPDVLNHWGIKVSDDFGHIVYNMIGAGIMSKTPEDREEDFFGVVDFGEYFKDKDCFKIELEFIKRIKGA
ncbi:MAG: hypothetical protein GX089_05535 [Fibrobacter sp.]|jgi:uncharacterized repeat protein (TIGR04138 family)|nr:hypothetical protein [Fibrobacter sp.]